MKKMFLILSGFILLAGCSEEPRVNGKDVTADEAVAEVPVSDEVRTDEATDASGEPIAFVQNGQEFQIYDYIGEYESYLKLAEAKPDQLKEAYSNTVLESFRTNAFQGDERLEPLNYLVFTPPGDFIPLQASLDALSDKRETILTTVKYALLASSEALPGGNKSFHVLPANPADWRTLAATNYVTGLTLTDKVGILAVDPDAEEANIAYATAHEYFHTVDLEGDESQIIDTLLEAAIMEGMADVFAERIFPEANVSWNDFATPEEKERVFALFGKNYNSSDPAVLMEFIMGNYEKGIPFAATYKIGYEIVNAFLDNNPSVSVEDLTDLTVREIYEGSGV